MVGVGTLGTSWKKGQRRGRGEGKGLDRLQEALLISIKDGNLGWAAEGCGCGGLSTHLLCSELQRQTASAPAVSHPLLIQLALPT